MNSFVPGDPNPTMDKRRAARLNYSWRWTKWLNGASIASFNLAAFGATVLQFSRSGDVVTALVGGGKVGQPAGVSCEIATNESPSQIEKVTLNLVIKDH
jgi:hypothetical protein